jgi:hypothetical protein
LVNGFDFLIIFQVDLNQTMVNAGAFKSDLLRRIFEMTLLFRIQD